LKDSILEKELKIRLEKITNLLTHIIDKEVVLEVNKLITTLNLLLNISSIENIAPLTKERKSQMLKVLKITDNYIKVISS